MTRLIPFASLTASPWKNGGGSTTKIAIAPPAAAIGDFDWRLSLATISQDGAFSIFPGIDRTLALVEGPGVVLDVCNGARVALSEAEPVYGFDGDDAVHATLNGGATTDFNVMTRRARCHHRFGRRTLNGISRFAPRGDVSVVFLAEGDSLTVSSDTERIALVRFDALLIEGDALWTLETGRAVIFIVDIFFDDWSDE